MSVSKGVKKKIRVFLLPLVRVTERKCTDDGREGADKRCFKREARTSMSTFGARKSASASRCQQRSSFPLVVWLTLLLCVWEPVTRLSSAIRARRSKYQSFWLLASEQQETGRREEGKLDAASLPEQHIHRFSRTRQEKKWLHLHSSKRTNPTLCLVTNVQGTWLCFLSHTEACVNANREKMEHFPRKITDSNG